MKKTILITAIISLAVVSCKDKEKEQPKPSLSARQTMLIGKDWKIKSVVSEGSDITPILPGCVKDNIIYHFNDATSGYYDEGATKCETTDPQRTNISWALINNETRIITSDPDGKDTFNILNLTATEFKLGIDKDVITLKN
mgnify:CR=1 FL=1